MKGIILAGGNGRRMEPITLVTNKHLLAVYDRPMIYYPINTLLKAGIKEIIVVTGKDHIGKFVRLLGSGKSFGSRFYYEVQEEAGGIAQALSLAEHFVEGDSVAVILGDNIFEDDFSEEIKDFTGGAHIFLKEVQDAKRFGVAELKGDKVIDIVEKPTEPKSNMAVTGFYLYDSEVFNVIRGLQPSARGEMEITDVGNHYIKAGKMTASFVKGDWTDAGTFESLFRANVMARKLKLEQQGLSTDIMKV
jgi:glucose-1-phosphate thymidylyltransferase